MKPRESVCDQVTGPSDENATDTKVITRREPEKYT